MWRQLYWQLYQLSTEELSHLKLNSSLSKFLGLDIYYRKPETGIPVEIIVFFHSNIIFYSFINILPITKMLNYCMAIDAKSYLQKY